MTDTDTEPLADPEEFVDSLANYVLSISDEFEGLAEGPTISKSDLFKHDV